MTGMTNCQLFSYHISKQEITKVSLLELIYGHEAYLPIDVKGEGDGVEIKS